MRTRVFITVDVEFSIAGTFDDPDRRRPVGTPNVYCPVDGRDNGLGFLMRTLGEHGLRGTFFVEALNSFYFGDAPMMEVANAIEAAGQDLQLHLHPCWTVFRDPDWREAVRRLRAASRSPDDSCATRSEDELVDLLSLGLAAFDRWGVARPVAVRAGNLQAGRAMYRAMARLGLPLASHVGVGLHRPQDAELQLLGGCHDIEGVTEMPVLTYFDLLRPGRRSARILTIAGTEEREMEHILLQCSRLGLDTVVILTHPFEFVRRLDPQFRRCEANPVTQRRLQSLCRFLAANAHRFKTDTFGSVDRRELVPAALEQRIVTPVWPALSRTWQNLRMNP